MFRKTLVWITVGLLAFALYGCSSSRDSDGSKTGIDEGPEYVGINVCVSCHDIKGQEWLYSRHGNSEPEGSPHSPHLPGESSCADCHNPLNDGDLLQQAFNTHEKRRDVIGCESCHGAGGQHYGLGPLPMPAPGPEVCGECHNRDDGHAGTDKSIYDKYASSRHAESLHGEDRNPCQRCHTNEGALKSNVAGYTGDKDVLGTSSDLGRRAPEAIPEEDVTAVGCATCHDPHEAGQLRQVWSSERDNDYMWDPNNNGSNRDQFDLCTSCHVLFNDEGTLVGSGTVESGTAPFYHETAWFRIIGTTHYDQPTDTDACNSRAESTIEGYNIRWNTENPCFDCHGHEFRTGTRPYPEGDDRDAPTIWTQWGMSGHGGEIFKVKLQAAADFAGVEDPADAPRSTGLTDAVMFAGASGSTGEAWNHYNWDHPGRASCQFCHTATGFVNYVADPENYDPANNDFSHLVNWGEGGCGSEQNEVLYCWGCHENAADGILRVTGAVTAVYTYNDEPVVFPDVGASNTCVVCHSGRGNNEEASTSSRFAGHHAPAAADLFSEYSHVAWEYQGLSYLNAANFVHDMIDAETTGPCVTCHMNGEEANHTFEVVEKDDNGVIVGIKSEACTECHGSDETAFAAALEQLSRGYQNAGDLLQDLINQENGLTNYTGAVINDDSVLENDRGAFQNAKLPAEEPGGFAHNSRYVRRAIFDAIDWVEDGSIDGTISDYSVNYAEAIAWLGTTRP